MLALLAEVVVEALSGMLPNNQPWRGIVVALLTLAIVAGLAVTAYTLATAL